MTRLFYIHWNQAELEERIEPLIAAGFEVAFHWSTGGSAKITEPYPAAVIISIDRLPSHGRAVAEWIWEAKKRQSIPIIFEGGRAKKVEATKAKFPRAIFCKTGDSLAALKRTGVESNRKASKQTTAKSSAKKKAMKPNPSKHGTFDDLIGRHNPHIQAISMRLREVVYEVMPKAEEKVWIGGWRIALYHDGEEAVCGIGPAREYCNFYLTHGAQIPDPDGLLEGTGKGMRHVKVRSFDAIPIAGIKKLIREDRNFIKKRRS